ncbi:DMT family transporter [Aliterella atlantica]|uniref:Membrane protein n=1 Tax=Aliterella atlantica CENA595 TaxID=1618023 RepID=A0A0D8ZWC1_9CYAN|nr:DMT family transporter [Aliterella atlantica]KJH73083.1 membrane protein [Aliterella atlantica CENA595]
MTPKIEAIALLTNFRGESAALGAACLWAISSAIYGRLGQQIAPLYLNLLKGAIAIALIIVTLLVRGELLPEISTNNLCLLLLSGAVGIGLGDTAFFAALNCLGARRALLMETLAPPITAIIALIFLQESPSAGAWLGIILTVLGVAWVVTERVSDIANYPLRLKAGIIYGAIAAFALAIGGVLARAALVDTSISPLWAALLRIIAGVLSLVLWILLKRPANNFAPKPFSFSFLAGLSFAAFAGTYLGIWLQQSAIKFTAVGIALTLTNTAPLFVLPIAAWSGEKLSQRAIYGAIIAIAGISTIFYLR